MKTLPIALLLIAAALQGCGGTDYAELHTNGTSGGSSGSNGSGGGSTGFNPIPTPTSTSSGSTTTSAMPPITTSFTITGSGGSNPSYSFDVDTDNILKVKITAGPASSISTTNVSYSNFMANYGCVSYHVSVLGQDVVTQTLSVPGSNSYICPGAPSSQTIDFSSRLTPGHNTVTIYVTSNGYDFYCQNCMTYPYLYNAGMGCSLYCPLHSVYKTHTVTGSMAVQVNGTSGI